MLGEVGFDFVAAGELALHFFLDWQPGLLAVELEYLVDGVEEFFGLPGSDLDFALRRLLRRRNGLGRFLLRLSRSGGPVRGLRILSGCWKQREDGSQQDRQKQPYNSAITHFSAIH